MIKSYLQRKALRLQNYDYAQNGAYFITLCTHNRECLFGEVVDDNLVLNDAGRMVEQSLYESQKMRPDVILDAFIIMPNHIHVIFFLIDTPIVGDALRGVPFQGLDGLAQRPAPTTKTSIPNLMYSFKSFTTNQYIHGVRNNQWQPFHGKLWQRGYYDRIIRNEEALLEIQQYIFNNPAQWASDENNIL
jgi:putative transposase